MASTTFSGPVRSEEGFLEKDQSGNWVPVSGGGGGGNPVAIPLRFLVSRYNTDPALPTLNISGQDYFIYDGTQATTITPKPPVGLIPGTYTNPTVTVGVSNYGAGFVEAASNGSPPPVVNFPTVSFIFKSFLAGEIPNVDTDYLIGSVPNNSRILDISGAMIPVSGYYNYLEFQIGGHSGLNTVINGSANTYVYDSYIFNQNGLSNNFNPIWLAGPQIYLRPKDTTYFWPSDLAATFVITYVANP